MDITEVNEAVVEEEKIGYRDILTQKQYLKIIASNVISRFGDSIDSIAFTWLVYAVTGSAAWSAIIFALNQLPSVLLQPFTGVLVEGMNKKRIMVLSDIVRGAVVALLGILYVQGLVNPWVLAIMTLIISSVEAFCLPASVALIPKIIDKKYYSFATSLNGTLSNVMQLIGLGIAGAIIGAFGVGAAMLIDAATFLHSAILTAWVKVKESNLKRGEWSAKTYFSDLKEGFCYLRKTQIVFNFCLIGVLANAVVGPVSSLQSPMAVEIFGLGSELLSIYGIAFVLGMSGGSFLLPYIMKKLKIRTIVAGSGILVGACYAGITLGKLTYGQPIPSYILCGTLALFLGIGFSWVSGIVNIQFMKNVEEDYLARAASIFNAAGLAASPIASFLISALLVRVSVSSIFLMAAAACVIVFTGAAVANVKME
ncbi:MAG: MFS transporter [Roseburia sp.]